MLLVALLNNPVLSVADLIWLEFLIIISLDKLDLFTCFTIIPSYFSSIITFEIGSPS